MMSEKQETQDEISEVFQRLGLETEEKRERLRKLEGLGRIGEAPGVYRYALALKNDTAREKDYAQLERTS